MTSRERVRRALAHQEPDRVPIDIGGHSASSMAPGSYANLCRHLSLPVPEQVRLMSKALQIVYMDEPVIQAVRSDCRPLIAPQLIATGPVAWEGGQFKDEWGVEWYRPESSAYYEVFRQNPELAIFLRKLESLERTLQSKSTLVLTDDTPPFDLLRREAERDKTPGKP